MAKPRKTVPVAPLVEAGNTAINLAPPAERPGLCFMVEQILQDADAYGGFQYVGGYPP